MIRLVLASEFLRFVKADTVSNLGPPSGGSSYFRVNTPS